MILFPGHVFSGSKEDIPAYAADAIKRIVARINAFDDVMLTHPQQKLELIPGFELVDAEILVDALGWLESQVLPVLNHVTAWSKHTSMENWKRSIAIGLDSRDVVEFQTRVQALRGTTMRNRPTLFLRKQIRPLIRKALKDGPHTK